MEWKENIEEKEKERKTKENKNRTKPGILILFVTSSSFF